MLLNEIESLWQKDSIVDDTMIDNESLKIPNLHAKYFEIFNNESQKLRKFESDYKKLYRVKWEYYNGKLSKEDLNEYGWPQFQLKIMKTDINIYIDSDNDLITIKDKIEYQKIKINYLDNIIKTLNNRGYLLKNVIDWRRFTQGQL